MNRTYYIKTSTPAYLADWFKLKDALAAFIRANYTDYSFDDAIKKKVSILPSKSTSMGGLTRCALPTLGATTTGCFSPLRMKQRSKLPQTRWCGCRITLSVSASVTRTLSATFSVRLPSTSTAPNALLTTRRQKSPKSRSTSRSSKACRKGKQVRQADC